FLEIIAEREIPEHLEKRVMPCRFPNFVEIVVLATRADTLLRRRSAHVLALLGAQERVFELIHARVREQQRRIVGGQERRRTHTGVSLLLKILQKSFANFVTSHHPFEFTSSVSSVVNDRIFSQTSSNPNPCRSK